MRGILGWFAVILFALLAGAGTLLGGVFGKVLWGAAGVVGAVAAINWFSYK